MSMRLPARPTRRDVGGTIGYVLAAIMFAFVPGLGLAWRPGEPSVPLWSGIVTALVLGVLHLFRRAAPGRLCVVSVAVLVGEALLTGTNSLGAVFIACDVLYVFITTRVSPRSGRLLPALAAACLGLAVTGLLLADALPRPALQSAVLLLAVGVTLWWGVTVRIPMNVAAHERERAELTARAAEAREHEARTAERMQISRELHDAISGHLSAIAMQSAAATAAGAEQKSADDLVAALTRIRASSLDALADMRTMIEVLRADDAGSGTVPHDWSSVAELVEQAEAGGTEVTLTGDDPSSLALGPGAAAAAYNVVREGLVNASKHAPGAPVTIDIARQRDTVRIELENSRELPVSSPGTGYGLIGLAERVRLCGGTLTTEQAGGRWRLRALLPLSPRQEVTHA